MKFLCEKFSDREPASPRPEKQTQTKKVCSLQKTKVLGPKNIVVFSRWTPTFVSRGKGRPATNLLKGYFPRWETNVSGSEVTLS